MAICCKILICMNSIYLKNKQKRNHQLPEGHELLPSREFYQYFKKNHLKNLEKNFIILAKKEVNDNEKEIYINEDSIVKGFEQVFGYKNESMAKRLYMYFANYKSKARVSFEQYMRRFFSMIYGSLSEKNRISFSMYDYDCNGSISSLDIYDLLKFYEEGSKLHQEAEILIKDISSNLV